MNNNSHIQSNLKL